MNLLASVWFVPAAALVALAAPPAPEPTTGLERFTPAFAVDDRGEGNRDLVMFDATGAEIARRGLDEKGAVFGPSHVLLADVDVTGPERHFEVIDTKNARAGEFTLPADRKVVLGSASLVVTPFGLHAAGTEFDVEFRSLDGGVLSHFVEPSASLAGFAPAEGGRWLALALGAGTFDWFGFDANGALLWRASFPRGVVRPVASMSPSGDRTVVGVMGDDLRSFTTHVLGKDGRELAAIATEPFDHVAFDPTGAKVALIGRSSLTILRQEDGAKLGASVAVRELLIGESVAFDSDGTRLFALSKGAEADGNVPIRLNVFSRLDAEPRERVKDVTDVLATDDVRAAGLSGTADHAVNVVLNVGQWSVKS